MRSWIVATAIAGCTWSAIAHADQCAVLDEATAGRAAELLRDHPDVVSFCEPCGDVAPEVPVHTARATTRRTAGGAEVVLDHRPIDLAYTYVQTSSHRYENLAALVACPTTGISPSLAIDDATPTGVVIHADSRPVAQVAIPAPVAQLPLPAPAPAPAPAIYIVTPVSSSGGWDLVVATCCVTTAVWWLGARLRRRRAMRPRATEL